MKSDIITVYHARNLVEAGRIQDLLEGEGIPCFLPGGTGLDPTGLGSLGSGFSQTPGTWEIRINRADETRVREILSELGSGKEE